MIAKTILDLFTLLPGASRSAAQSSDQPLQAFSDSLLAAAKSFSQDGNAISASSKTVRGQSSASGSSNTSVAVLDGGEDLSADAPQPSQGDNANPSSPQTSVVGSTASEVVSTETATQSGLIQSAVDPAAGQPAIAQTGDAQASFFAARLVRATGFQSKFAGIRTLRAGSVTSRIVSTGVATRPFRNVTVTKLASSQSNAPGIGAAHQAAVQTTDTSVQISVAAASADQIASTIAANEPTQSAPATGWNQTELSLSPTSTASMGPSQPAAVQTDAILEPADSVRSIPLTNLPPLAAQPNFASLQTPVTQLATTQGTSTSVASQSAPSLPASASTANGSIFTLASILSTSIPRPASVPSGVTQEQTSAGAPATSQNTETVVADQQPTQIMPVAGRTEADQGITPTNIVPAEISQTSAPQLAADQSSITLAQAPPVQPVTAQVAATGENSQPPREVRTAEPVEAHSSVSPKIVSQTSIAPASSNQKTVIEPTVDQTSVTPPERNAQSNSASHPATKDQELQTLVTAQAKSGNADTGAVVAAVPDAAPAPNNSGVQDPSSPAAVNASSNAVQSTVANTPEETTPGPVLHEAVIASVKDVAAPALKTGSTAQTDPQPVAVDQSSAAKTTTAQSGTADPLALMPLAASIGMMQTNAAIIKPAPSAKPQANASATGKGASTDQTGAKKIAEPASPSGTKTGSQDAAASGNQNQSGNAAQAQIATPVPVSFTIHPAAVIAAAQNTAPAATNHTSTPAEAAAVAAKTTDSSTAQGSTALPQASPVINTARLIQSMGQSEMRVGMRSNEFGNISISTSATRDQVSAQISVEHGELAKTLTAHLPEMQSRLGSSQPMEVRIDMNGAATGQGTGNFGSASNDSAGQSRGGRPQAGNMEDGQSGISVVEHQFSPVVAAVPSGYARLDIRV